MSEEYPPADLPSRRFAYGGDFGPPGTPSDEAFCINGLVQPDRRPNPHAHEARRAMQPIHAAAGPEGVGPCEAQLVVSNEHDFLPLSLFVLHWEVQEEGAAVRRGCVELPACAPHRCCLLALEHTPPELALPGCERHLLLRFVRKSDRAEVGWAQFELGAPPTPALLCASVSGAAAVTSLVDVEGSPELMVVAGAEFTVAFSRATGLPSSLRFQGEERLAARLEPTLWRPMNDNELGSGRHRALRRWREAGRPSREDGYMRMLTPLRATTNADGSVVVRSRAALTPDGNTVLHTTCTVHPHATAVEVRARVVLSGGGDAEPGSPGQEGGEAASPGVVLCDGATVSLRSEEVRLHLDVEGALVRTRWNDAGPWQQLTVRAALERPPDDSPVRYGDAVFLVAHTGVPLSAAPGGVLSAGVPAPGAAQRFVLEPADGGARAGETIVCGAAVTLRAATVGWSRAEYVAPGAAPAVGVEGPPLPAGGGEVRLSEAPAFWRLEAGRCTGLVEAPLRVGFECALSRERATHVRWFGRGPHESYPDRKESACVGRWAGRVGEQAFGYVRPQETGNKMETRWMALSDEAEGAGTLVVALGGPLSMTCHHHALDDLDTRPGSRFNNVRHAFELESRDLTTLCVDGAVAGVGGIDSWGAQPLSHHLLRLDQPVEWAFALRPFSAREDPAALIAEVTRA